MERMSVRNTYITNIYYYKSASVHSIETAVAFLLNIRKNSNVFMEHIDLDDSLRCDEGSMSTVLDGGISKKRLIEEIVRRNVDKVTVFAKIFDETVLVGVNLHSWNISVSLKLNSRIDIAVLEKYLEE